MTVHSQPYSGQSPTPNPEPSIPTPNLDPAPSADLQSAYDLGGPLPYDPISLPSRPSMYLASFFPYPRLSALGLEAVQGELIVCDLGQVADLHRGLVVGRTMTMAMAMVGVRLNAHELPIRTRGDEEQDDKDNESLPSATFHRAPDHSKRP